MLTLTLIIFWFWAPDPVVIHRYLNQDAVIIHIEQESKKQPVIQEIKQ